MNMRAIVTQVQERKSTTKAGAPITYRDVFLADTNPDIRTRYPAEIVIRPNQEEYDQYKISEGSEHHIFIRQVLELRNGLPVCRVAIKPPGEVKKAAA